MKDKTEERQCDWWRTTVHGWTGKAGWCDKLPDPKNVCKPLQECRGPECRGYTDEEQKTFLKRGIASLLQKHPPKCHKNSRQITIL